MKVIKTKKELKSFGTQIQNKLYELHGLCYSDESNDVFDAENDCLIDQIECVNEYVDQILDFDYTRFKTQDLIDLHQHELEEMWKMCLQIEKYYQAVTQTPRPDYIYA